MGGADVASVIAGFDGSPGSCAALSWAVQEARLRNVPLRVLTFLDALESADVVTQDFGTVRAQLGRVVADLAADQPVAYEVVPGSPQAGLVEACAADDLLVVGSRGRSALAELLLGSVSHACLRAAAGPVAIVPSAAEPGRTFGRVIVGVDGSQPARRALRAAAAEADLREAALQAVHAVYWDPVGAEFTTPDTEQLTTWGRHLLTAELRETEVAARPVVIAGHPADVLTRHSSHADLLVLGSRGHDTLAALLAGSTADHCARHARCPVMIIR